MSSLLLPLILFVGFIGFRIASIMATRKREAQLRAAWRAEVDATRDASVRAARALRAPLASIIAATERLQAARIDRSPAELAELTTIAAAGRELAALVDDMRTEPADGPRRDAT